MFQVLAAMERAKFFKDGQRSSLRCLALLSEYFMVAELGSTPTARP